MMTAKEKAKELIDKYEFYTVTHYTGLHEQKQMALIAVSEILESFEQLNPKGLKVKFQKMFFESVQEEIERFPER